MLPVIQCDLIAVSRSAIGGRNPVQLSVVNLLDAASYTNVRYAPAIAPRSIPGVAGASQFAPVADTITVDIVGDTPPRAYEALARVLALVEQGRAWAAGENVNTVEIRVKIRGDTASGYWYALVLGPPGNDPIATLPGQYVSVGGTERYVIPDVPITFLRSGRWLREPSVDASSSALTMPAAQWVTFTSPMITQSVSAPTTASAFMSAALPSPTALREIYFMLASSTAGLVVSNADTGVPATGFSLVADAANFPPSGNVLRYTPPGLRVSAPIFTRSTGTSRRANVFVAVRANNTASAFLVGVRIESLDSILTNVKATYDSHFVYVSGTDSVYGNERPRILAFGTVPVTVPWRLRLRVIEAISPAAGTCDIAYVAVQDADDPMARVVRIALPSGYPTGGSPILVVPEDIGLQGGSVLDSLDPVPFTGSTDFATFGPMLGALLITTQNAAWVPNNGTSRLTISYSFSARPARLVPE